MCQWRRIFFWPACSYSLLKSWFMPHIRADMSRRLILLRDSVMKWKVSLFHPRWQEYLEFRLVQPVLLQHWFVVPHSKSYHGESRGWFYLYGMLADLGKSSELFSAGANGHSLWIHLMWFRNTPLFLWQACPWMDYFNRQFLICLYYSNVWGYALGRVPWFFTRHVSLSEKLKKVAS